MLSIENTGLLNRDITSLQKAFREFPEIEKVVLFGSRAMGNFKKGSDIDIAISGEGITSRTVSKLSAILNEESPLPYFVEVIDYQILTNPELKQHIDQFGKEIYNRKKDPKK